MSFPDGTTLAPAIGGSIENKALVQTAQSMVRKALIIATYDSSKTGINDNVPKQYLSVEAVADELGWGSPAHRLAKAFAEGSSAIQLYVAPQAEDAAATAAAGSIVVSATTAEAGTISLYVGDELIEVGVSAGDSADAIASAIAAAINAEPGLPVSASAATGTVTVTAKSKGTFGNSITLAVNLDGQALPSGVTLTITQLSGGATDPDIQDVLDELGTGDASNSLGITDVVCAYAAESAKFSKLSVYNGIGNTKTGCYAPTVGRPMRAAWVSVDSFTNMKAITDDNVLDRTNAFIAAPGIYRHPAELAAKIVGITADINQANAHRSYVGEVLGGHTSVSGRWTDTGASRDAAIKAGIATTRVDNNVLVIDGLVTMYRPSSVAADHNAYRSYRNISILQNILKNHRDTWAARPSFTVVEDAATVDPREKPFVLDILGVKGINTVMVGNWKKLAWLYSDEYTIKNQVVTLRAANNGFDIQLPIILSAEGVVSDTVIYTDISLSVTG